MFLVLKSQDPKINEKVLYYFKIYINTYFYKILRKKEFNNYYK